MSLARSQGCPPLWTVLECQQGVSQLFSRSPPHSSGQWSLPVASPDSHAVYHCTPGSTAPGGSSEGEMHMTSFTTWSVCGGRVV